MSSLGEVVRSAAQRHADHPLYVTPTGATFSYRDLDVVSDQAALGMLERGVREGDVVAVLLPSGPAYGSCYAAASKIGAITAGVNERLSPLERARCLEVAGPRLVVAPKGTTDQLPPQSLVVEVDPEPESEAKGALADALLFELRPRTPGGDVPPLSEDPSRPVAIVFTSGTTGQPKGAVFCDRQLDAVSDADGRMAWGGGGRGLSPTSFAHVGYMTKLPQALRFGGTTYLMRRWSAATAIELAERHHVTTLGGIPTQMELMLRHESFEKADLSSVALVSLGGAASTAALIRECRARLRVPVIVRYTCTEAGVGTGTDPTDPEEDAEETVGRPRLGVEVTVRDEDEKELPLFEIGQVCLSSAAVMSGYYKDEEATRAAFTADGAFKTGDMGFIDDRGRLHLTGRSKEMYVRGGYNVFPAEVEGALSDHPLVAHVAVAPRPDRVMGEIGVAVVVPRARSQAPSLDSLREHARGRLASYKLPEDLVLAEEIPRTAMDKVDRKALSKMVAPDT